MEFNGILLNLAALFQVTCVIILPMNFAYIHSQPVAINELSDCLIVK